MDTEREIEVEETRRFVETMIAIGEKYKTIMAGLVDLYGDNGAYMYLICENKRLNGERPIDAIMRGRGSEVLALINQLQSGAYV